MITKQLMRKGTSLFLSLALFTSALLPQNAIAQGTAQPVPTSIQELQDTAFTAPSKEKRELPEHRTEFSKRFQNLDGTFTEEIFNRPIHYKDKTNGKWEAIDSNLTLDALGDYQNKDPRFNVKLKATANAGFLSFSKDNANISIRPIFAGSSKGEVKGNKIQYTNAATDTDLSYSVLPEGLKEDIVLKSSNTPSTFTFEMKLDNLTYQMAEDGGVNFFKTGQSEPLFTMIKPFMFDANRHYSQSVQYNIRKDNENKLWIDVVADPAWLKDSSRTYPVTIDPPFLYNATFDTFVESLNTGNKNYNYLHNLIGNCVDHGRTRSMFYFDIPKLPSGTVITDAKFNVFNEYAYVLDNPVVDIYPIHSNWSAEQMNWTEYEKLTTGSLSSSYSVTDLGWWNIPMTQLINDWYNGTQPQFGFEMRYRDENKVCRELISADDPDESFRPYMSLTYTLDGLGSQSFWTFDGPVNMVNRNLVLSATDINYAGRQSNLTLSRTYNSRSTQSGLFGYGWTSPFDMRINYATKGPARLIDNTGTEHRFYQKADGTYEPLEGLNWNLTVSGTTAVVTTLEQSKYVFSNGRLTKIENANGNALHVYYYATETLLQDDAGNNILFKLSNGRVASAQDVAGHVWTYKYDADGNLTHAISPDEGATLQYRYDKNHNLIASVTPSGKATYYSYSDDDRAVAINPINAVINSNFEVDADGDAAPDHFTFNDGIPGLAIDSASGTPFGKKAAKISLTTPGTSNYKVYVSNPIPVDPTKTYTVSALMKANQTSGQQKTVVSVLAYRADGVYIGELGPDPVYGPTASEAGGWIPVKHTLPAGQPQALPSGTSTVYIKVAASNLTGSGTSWFDGVHFEESPDATAFVAGDQYTANASGMQTARYDGDGLKELYQYNDQQNLTEYWQDPQNYKLITKYNWDSNKLSTVTDPKGAISSQQYDSKGNVIQSTDPTGAKNTYTYDSQNNLTQSTGPIDGQRSLFTYDQTRHQKTSRDPHTTSTAQGHDNFGNKTNETNLLGWADNLVDNSGFEGNTNADGTPVRFVYNEGQTGQWSLSSDAAAGGKSLKITSSAAKTSNYTVLVSDLIPLSPTSDYVLAGQLKTQKTSGNQTTIFALYAYDSLGARIGEVGRINSQTPLDTWQRVSVPIRKADLPTGTTQVRIKLAAKNAEGSGSSSFDNIQLQKNPIDTAYNLLDNSSFERGTASGVSRWTRLNTNGGTFNWLTSPVYAGTRSLAIANAAGDNGFVYDQYLSYDPKKAYNFTAFVKTENLSPSIGHLRLEFYKADKSKILTGGDISSVKVGGTADWKRLFVELGAGKAPLETAYVRPVLASGASTGTIYFDNVRLQEEGVTTRYLYDASTNYTRMTQMTNALGQSTKYQYDQIGNIRFVTTPMGHTSETRYDALSRITAVIPPTKDEQVKREYDADGHVEKISITDGAGTTEYAATTMTHHPSGQIAASSDPLGRTRAFSYTPAGRLQKTTFPDGKSISLTYSPVGQVTNVVHDGANRYSYGYDGNSNNTSVWDSLRSVEVKATYDPLNRLQSWTNGSRTLNYQRDTAGNITGQTLLIGQVLDKSQTIQYNLVNQATSLTDVSGTHKFLYNEHGKLSTIQLGNQTNERRVYDSVGRITQILNQNKDGKTLSSYSYKYDNDGNVTSVTDQYGQVLNYTHDANGRLEVETLPSGNQVTYSYNRAIDPLGNRTGRTETHPNGTTVKETAYEYDKASQLTKVDGSEQWEYNARGYVTKNSKYSFQWDTAGRLISVTKANETTPFATYQYDHLDRRVQETVNSQTTHFFYEGTSNRVLAEYDGSGVAKKYYVWGPANRLLSINVEGVTYYPLYNGHGDIVQLTNAAGDVVAWYQYDAWGNMTSHSDGTDWAKNPYRYSGYRYDDATGLYYLNARYYDPSVGRFLSPDAVYETSEYSYALDNPIHLSDPSGLRPMCQCEESFSAPKYSYETAWWEENVNAVLRPIAELGAAIAAESKIGPAMVAGNAIQIGMDRADAKRAERSCNCFTAGTKVLTDEVEKNIEDIEVGDRVLAKDEYNPEGELAYKEVTALYRNQRDDIIKLHVGKQIIETTDNHPFWVEEKGWVYADELHEGDKLQKADGSNLTIDKVEFVKLGEPVTVYNFTVADYHTYYVTDLGIWVHNTNCMFGANGVQTTSKTIWKENGSKARIDVENPNPGQRSGQIHYQDANNEKYLFDSQKGAFVDPTGNLAPKRVNKMLKDPNFVKKLNVGLTQYLGESPYAPKMR